MPLIKVSNIPTTAIADQAITSDKIANGAVTATDLHTTAITDKLGYTPVTEARTITINDTSYDLTANRSWTVASAATPAAVSDQANTSTGYFDLPAGSTAQRPETPSTGMIRYNTTTGVVEQYNASGWQPIDSPPIATTFSGTINADTNSTITVNGFNFKSGSVVYIEGDGVGGVSRALTTTFVSSTQLTAATNATSVNYVGGASFDVKVTNPSGLSSQLTAAGSIDRDPIWVTSAGTVATITDASSGTLATLVASDADGNAITYSVTSGALPTGTSLNTSTGIISGNPDDIVNSTTYTFGVTATSNSQSVARSFNIIVNPGRDGSTSARATTPYVLRNLGITTNGVYWIRALNTYDGVTQSEALRAYVYFNLVDSKDWVLMMELNQSGISSGSIVTTNTPQDSIGRSIPWKGFNLQLNGSDTYSYFTSYQPYNNRGSSATTTGGNKAGYYVYLGGGGSHGFYNTGQGPCNWNNSSGAFGAGFDGNSCGGYPNSLRMGYGTGSSHYSQTTGNFKTLVWMDNAE